MKRIFKKLSALFLMCTMLIPSFQVVQAAEAFRDVPQDHWAKQDIQALRDLGITDGIGDNQFGIGQSITRADFVTFLAKLLQWNTTPPASGSFSDNTDRSAWYYAYVEAAVKNDAIPAGGRFRPSEPITRREMAIMLVRSMGYDQLAQQLASLGSPFSDVSGDTGYITIASDFGIISGAGNGQFMPDTTATREQAAAMMMRMYRNLSRGITFKNGFYAINSSSQMNLISSLDAVSFGWSRLESVNGVISLNMTGSNNNEYRVPEGFSQPLSMVQASGGKALLMVTASESNGETVSVVQEAITAENRERTAEMICAAVSGLSADAPSFDGVVIDFENLKGEQSKSNLNAFLSAIKTKLNGKLLYVAVHPVRKPGQAYYDGYDYKTIGNLADKVILMAHDYNAKRLTAEEMELGWTTTPLTLIDEVYYSLKAITDKDTGIMDKSKIVLQISYDTAQWKTIDGKIINATPYRPDYQTLANRMAKGVKFEYSKKLESPYITFHNEDDGTENIVWYEDQRSVQAKIELATMMGVTGLSVWRLGNIPDFAINATFFQ